VVPEKDRFGRLSFSRLGGMFRNLLKIMVASMVLLGGCGKPVPSSALKSPPERIVSLAPNITETIYALGLGDKLVGDTSFCCYPQAACAVSKVGGFGQFNYEAIVALRPDLVILHKEYDIEKARLATLGIPVLETGSYFVADILETIRAIGKACDADAEATELIENLKTRMANVRKKAGQGKRPRVLLTFGSGDLGTIQAFGSACIHSELLRIAGGQNVIEQKLPFVTLSREVVIRLNPDIIIELAPEQPEGTPPSTYWEKLGTVNAVKNHRIYLLTGDYTCIPGPRFIQTLDDFAEIFP
jgi:iron complex transport system substrate-binding protein